MNQDIMDAKILTQKDAADASVDPLPPAGFERDEELRRRADELERKVEMLMSQMDIGAINPKVFEKDREIQHAIQLSDGLQVEGALDTHMYCWVNYNTQHGTKVWQKKSLGWEVVSGDAPECRNHIKEDNTRRIGDVLLMRIPKDLHLMLEMKAADRRRAIEFGVDSDLRDITSKHRDAMTYHGDVGDTSAFKAQRAAGARQVASQQLNTMLKRGTVPGLGKAGA